MVLTPLLSNFTLSNTSVRDRHTETAQVCARRSLATLRPLDSSSSAISLCLVTTHVLHFQKFTLLLLKPCKLRACPGSCSKAFPWLTPCASRCSLCGFDLARRHFWFPCPGAWVNPQYLHTSQQGTVLLKEPLRSSAPAQPTA